MTLPGFLSWNWSLVPFIIALIAIAGYVWITRFNRSILKTSLFFSGVIIGEIALAIPLGPVPAGYSASAFSCALPGGTLLSLHMVRHVLLLLVSAPLLVAGLPVEPLRQFLSRKHIKPWAKRLSSPYVGGIVGVGTMWFWHVPPVYNYLVTYGAGLGHLMLSIAEVLSLIIAGAMLAWPVLSPLKEYRIHPLKGALYMFLSCVGCSILGMAITFGATGYFQTAFASQPGPIWGLTQKVDQEIAGLFMWVPGCILYVTGAMASIARWVYQLKHPEIKRKAISAKEKLAEEKQLDDKEPVSLPNIGTRETVTSH